MEITFDQQDEFKRKVIAENLLKLFSSEAPISPVVIDGPWGSGKTFFCHKFINLSVAKETKYKCVYIDAFKFDHADDPLLMLITAISSLIDDKDIKGEFIKKAVPVVKVLGKTAGKAAVAWILKTNADKINEEISEAIASSSDEIIDDGIEKVFENFEKAEENLKIFRDAMAKVAEKQKIVIVIDELDRCRPSFALALLEKIKHVFDVQGVSFLLAVNIKQTEAIVKKQYGYEIDAETYLSKFFSFVVHLPQDHELGNREFNQNSYRLFFDLAQSDEALKKFCGNDSWNQALFKVLFERHGRSLRDVEKFYRNIKVFNELGGDYSIKENTMWAYVTFMLVGIYIYTFEPALAQKLLRDEHTLNDIADFLGVGGENLKEDKCRDFRAHLFATFALDKDDRKLWSSVGEEMEKHWETSISKSFDHGRGPGKGQWTTIFQKTIRKLQFI